MPAQDWADLILLLHAALATFIVSGLGFILVGNRQRWQWVNDPVFRYLHAIAISLVLLETWLGLPCPLTDLEMWLRSQAGSPGYPGSFMAYWVQRLLYHAWPPWLFGLIYTGFGALVAAAWWRFPPRSRH